MSFLKKLLVLVCCTIAVQTAFAMQKKQFGKVFKTYVNKSTKKALNGSKQKTPLTKMPKISFGNAYLKNMHWKKIAAAGALATSYGLWQWNANVVSADAPVQEKSWDELTEEEKDKLAAKYGEGIWNYFVGSEKITGETFRKASALEKEAMIYALTKRSKREYKNSDIYTIYQHATESQKNSIAHVIAGCLQQGYSVQFLNWIYIDSDQNQRTILAPAVAQYLNQGHAISDIKSIYEHSQPEQRTLLIPGIAKLIKSGHEIDIYSIYTHSDEAGKNSLVPFIAERLRHGHSVERLHCIYREHSNQNQKNIIAVAVAGYLKQGKMIPLLEEIYKEAGEEQRDSLALAIAERISQGKEVYNHNDIDNQSDYLYGIYYEYSNAKQRDILAPALGEYLKKGCAINPNIVQFIYSCSSEIQRDHLASGIAASVKRGHLPEGIDSIYQESSEQQKSNLAPAIADYFTREEISKDEVRELYFMYDASSDNQKKTLFPSLLKHIEQRRH